MIAGAKATLLQQEQIDIFQPSAAAKGYFPGGWSRAGNSSPDNFNTRPRLQRSNTHQSFDDSIDCKGSKEICSTFPSSSAPYVAPVPAYAVSPADPIPKGYVVHARDGCVDVDLQWDSIREPQDWGDGGELGESWSGLHKRIRTGLFKMISWYKQHDAMEPTLTEVASPSSKGPKDDNRELVLILVTHSAGCNALIGALTNQPVLIDVGMASLTMAVRKQDTKHTNGASSIDGQEPTFPQRRRSSVDFGLSEEYEMHLLASIDHLRAAAEASRATALQSPHLVPQIPAYARAAAVQAANAPPIGVAFRPQAMRPVNSSLGSVRRSNTVATHNHPASAATSRSTSGSSVGLWSAASRQEAVTTSLDGAADGSTGHIEELSLGPSMADNKDATKSQTDSQAVEDTISPLSAGSSRSNTGLWSQVAPPLRNSQIARVQASKRRWTMSENDG